MENVKLVILYLACPLFLWVPYAQAKFFEWDYDHHHTRQENWNGTCRFGLRQSPINIDTRHTTKQRLNCQPLVFHGYDKKVPAKVKNNGHTAVVMFTNGPDNEIWVKGGGLGESKFEYAQAHFHWGSTNNQGSEHTINNKSAPMEMHLVHWNLDVGGTFKDAVKKDTGISLEVLGVMFEIGEKNQKFSSLFRAITKIRNQNATAEIEGGITLNDLLPSDTDAFYRYKGSLTTPSCSEDGSSCGCHEIVMWTIFKKPIEISQDQLDVMRQTTYTHSNEHFPRDISNNYRDLQPLHEREVLDVDTHAELENGEYRIVYDVPRVPREVPNVGVSSKACMRNTYFGMVIFIIFLNYACCL